VELISPERFDALNEALQLMHFGFRALVHGPDEELARHGLGRAQHRLLYFIARRPGQSVQELGARLAVTRQALHEALRPLAAGGFVRTQPAADDRRRRLVALTPAGEALEASLSGSQRALLAAVFDQAGAEAEAGWRAVMAALAHLLPSPADAPPGGDDAPDERARPRARRSRAPRQS